MKINVILLKDVKNIGTKGETVSVQSGLAHNKLIPQKEAIIASKNNINRMNAIKRTENKNLENQKNIALKEKELIEGEEFIFLLEVHDNKAIGTVTSSALADKINEQCKTNLDKKNIKLEHISNVGSYIGTVNLFKGIKANIRIVVKRKNPNDK